MRAIILFLAVTFIVGCSTIRANQMTDAYNAKMAANATEYGNGQILLSEKLRRDYLAGIQFGQINKIEAACTESYMWLARDLERGTISESRFNDKRDSLEMACAEAYASGRYAPVDAWRTMYAWQSIATKK